MNEKESKVDDNISSIEEVVKLWRLGTKLDEDGYEELGLINQQNALTKARTLNADQRKIIADILFPIKQ